MAVGIRYTAQVTRRDGGAITLHGTPEYAGSQAGQETRAALWAAHTLAQTRIEALRAERDAARRNALELAAPLCTGAQLHGAWAARKPPGGWQ